LLSRLGYALYGSPFKAGENANAARSSYTTGIGFRQGKFFMDLAYIFYNVQPNIIIYTIP